MNNEATETEKDRIELIDAALKEKGETWVIAAMVDGSIGYHTADHAKRIIQRFRKGKTVDYCERCAACYSCDLTIMLAHDVIRFEQLEASKQNAIIEYVEAMSGRDYMVQLTGSMLYPDHRPR